MNVTIYIPDELGKRLKEAKLERGVLSQIFKSALEEELMQQQAFAKNEGKMEEIVLDLEDENGRSYKGRFRGILLAEGSHQVDMYQKENGSLLAHDLNKNEVHQNVVEDDEDFIRSWFADDSEAYVEAMHAIGKEPIIDI